MDVVLLPMNVYNNHNNHNHNNNNNKNRLIIIIHIIYYIKLRKHLTGLKKTNYDQTTTIPRYNMHKNKDIKSAEIKLKW